MKRFAFLIAIALALASIAGCNALNAPLTPQQVADVQKAAADQQQAVADLRTIAANLPAKDSVGKAAGTAAAAVDKATPAAQGAATAAAQPGATQGDVIGGVLTGAVPLIPQPYASYVGLAGLLYGMYRDRQKNKAQAAATSMQSGLSAAIGNGSITVSPAAIPTVDAIVTSHPTTDLLIDTLTAAAKK